MADEGIEEEDYDEQLGKLIYSGVFFETPPCPRCSSPIGYEHIHGHMQCKSCKSVIEDCCNGETECMSMQSKK